MNWKLWEKEIEIELEGKDNLTEDNIIELWDKKADEWAFEYKNDYEKENYELKRATRMRDFLIKHGALNDKTQVVDVGCGIGRFATTLALHAKSATAIDISSNMIKYSKEYADERRIENIYFKECDFNEVDLDKEGLTKQFDLACAMLTPAIKGEKGLDNFMKISRKHCFKSFMINMDDSVENWLRKRLRFNPITEKTEQMSVFTLLTSLLFIKGYYPIIEYDLEVRSEKLELTYDVASLYASKLTGELNPNKEVCQAVLELLHKKEKEEGALIRESTARYGLMLWDVSK